MPQATNPRSPRRILAAVAAWLAFGAALTVFVAWLTEVQYGFQSVHYSMTLFDPTRPDFPRPHWSHTPPPGWPDRPDAITMEHTLGWSIDWEYSPSTPPPTREEVSSEFGLPFHALSAWNFVDRTTTPLTESSSGFIAIFGLERFLRIRGLVIHPLWPGFALNTLFYAALAWSLSLIYPAIRRHRRRRAGKCTNCGYDLKGLAPSPDTLCPECGAPVEHR